MPTPIKPVLERVVGMLEDESSTTWTLADLVRYANDGQADMVVRRPDLFNTYVEHSLVAGWRQRIPADGIKLIEVYANGVGSRRPCTKVNRSLLDAQAPGWRAVAEALEVDHFMFDERDPERFDVYPPARVGAVLALQYVRRPTDTSIPAPTLTLEDLTGDADVPDEMRVALQHYIAMRCFGEGSEDANLVHAEKHLSLYAQTLGVEIEATRAVAPKTAKP